MISRGRLSQYFTGVAAKRLSAVEADVRRSNQHEFNGVRPLRELLGGPSQFHSQLIWLTDADDDLVTAEAEVTWYDSRQNQPHRSSEYRLYFPSTAVSERASEGDLLVIGRRPDDTLLIAIAKAGTTIETQILWLFGLPEPGTQVEERSIEGDRDVTLGFAARRVLEYLGIEIEKHDESFLDAMLRRFGEQFPTTDIFSTYARETLDASSETDTPDAALIAWMEHEELLFRTLERHIVNKRLKSGFSDVDEFVAFSLSVQNRRKARAGRALENHFEHILRRASVRYARGQITENNAKPDFLFPGADEYRDKDFPDALLLMLGVKSSCRDRWRQVLSEAHRIKHKHLLTMEPGISENQTSEMRASSLSLVVPAGLHSTYSPSQRAWLLDVQRFLEFVSDKQ